MTHDKSPSVPTKADGNLVEAESLYIEANVLVAHNDGLKDIRMSKDPHFKVHNAPVQP